MSNQHLKELSTRFERFSKKEFTFGREVTDFTKHYPGLNVLKYTQKTINFTSALALISFVLDISSDVAYIWKTPKQNALLGYGMLLSMLLPHVVNLIRFTIKIHERQIQLD